MGKGGASLVEMIGRFFLFILELILDIICTCLLLASLAAFWRWPFMWYESMCKDRWVYRGCCLLNFGAMLLDILTIPIFFATLCTWRGLILLYVMGTEGIKSFSSSDAKKYYNVWFRGMIWEQFVRIFMDIPFIIMLVFTTFVTFWRNYWLWPDLVAQQPWNYCACCWGKDFHDLTSDKDCIKIITREFLLGWLDILMLPFLLVILLTGYRIPTTLECVAFREDFIDKKVEIMLQALVVFIDIPFGIMGLFVLLIPFRAKAMLEDCCELHEEYQQHVAQGGIAPYRYRGDLRALIALHFICTIRDLLVFPLFFPVLLSVYRGFFAITQIIAAVSRWAPDTPKLNIASCTFSAPDRGTGLYIHLKGTKDPNFALTEGDDVKLFIRNSGFWSSVKSAFGGTVASVGPTMLPMKLNPRFMQPEACVVQGQANVDFTIDLNTHYKTKTIFKNAGKLWGNCLVQIEYGSHAGTLFNLDVTPQTIESACATGAQQTVKVDLGATPKQMAGERLCDVFWRIVLLQFLFLLLDIIALICLIIMHLFPHRIYRVYSQGCEGSDRMNARKMWKLHTKMVEALQNIPLGITNGMEEGENEMRGTRHEYDPERHEWGYSNYGWHGYRSSHRWRHKSSRTRSKEEGTSKSTLQELVHELDNMYAHCLSLKTEDGAVNCIHEGKAIITKSLDTYRDSLVSVLDPGDGPLYHLYPEYLPSLPEPRKHGKKNQNLFDQVDRQSAKVAHGLHMDDMQKAIMASLGTAGQMLGVIAKPAEEVKDEPTPAPAPPRDPVVTPGEISEAAGKALEPVLKNAIDLTKKKEQEYDDAKWCGGKEGWAGLRTIIFREVAHLLYDFAALLCFIFVLCTLYRTYSLMWAFCNKRDKRFACICMFLEVLLDVVYLLKFCVVLAGIRGIFTMPPDLMVYLAQKPTFYTARQVIDYHLSLFLVDLLYVVSLVFAWDAFRAFWATLAFGLFAPGVMLEAAFSKWEIDDRTGSFRTADRSTCFAGWILFFSVFWMIGMPCIIGYPIAAVSPLAARLTFFIMLAVILFISTIVACAYADTRTASFRRCVVQYLRSSIHNVTVFFALLLETIFLVAFAFAPATDAMYGAGNGTAMAEASKYVFLIFGEGWSQGGIPFGVYFSMAIACLHFFVSAAPIVMGDILHWRHTQELIKSPVWISVIQFTGQMMMPLVVRNFAALLYCDEVGKPAMMYGGQDVRCWQGNHQGLSVAAMVALIYYIPSTLMRSAKYDEAACGQMDIVYAQIYKLLVNSALGTMTVVTLMTMKWPAASGIVLMLGCLWNIFWTVAYGPIFNKEEGLPCSVRSLVYWRVAMYSIGFGAGILSLIGHFAQPGQPWPLYALAALVGFCIIVAYIVSFVQSKIRTPEDDSIDTIRDIMLRCEKDMKLDGMTMAAWQRGRHHWKHEVNTATRASQLALRLLQLERHVHFVFLTPMFYKTHNAWKNKVDKLVSDTDREKDMDLDFVDPADQMFMILVCCDWGCCSHYHSYKDNDYEMEMPEAEKLPLLTEAAMALENAIHASRRFRDQVAMAGGTIGSGYRIDFSFAPRQPPVGGMPYAAQQEMMAAVGTSAATAGGGGWVTREETQDGEGRSWSTAEPIEHRPARASTPPPPPAVNPQWARPAQATPPPALNPNYRDPGARSPSLHSLSDGPD